MWTKDHVVVPAKSGTFIDASAIVKFQEDGQERQVLSSNVGMVLVVSGEEYEAYFQSHYKAWAAYVAVLGIIISYSYRQYQHARSMLTTTHRKQH